MAAALVAVDEKGALPFVDRLPAFQTFDVETAAATDGSATAAGTTPATATATTPLTATGLAALLGLGWRRSACDGLALLGSFGCFEAGTNHVQRSRVVGDRREQ